MIGTVMYVQYRQAHVQAVVHLSIANIHTTPHGAVQYSTSTAANGRLAWHMSFCMFGPVYTADEKHQQLTDVAHFQRLAPTNGLPQQQRITGAVTVPKQGHVWLAIAKRRNAARRRMSMT
jgi:hypothetical protein